MADKIEASLKGGLGTHFPVKDSPEKKKEGKSEPDATTTAPLALLLLFLMIIRVVQW